MPEQYPYPQTDWMSQLGKPQMTEQEQFMIQHHRSNLAKGGVKNKDGTTSTYKAIGVEADGRYYMLPTVWDNKLISNDEAIKRADQVGFDKFPSYANQGEARDRYKVLHDYMEQDLQGK